MTALLFGAGGFLGNATLGTLRQQAVDVVAVSRTPTSGYVACDIADPIQLLGLLDRVKPSIVINAAVRADFDATVDQLFSVNVLAPALIASWCANNQAYLVQVSGTIVHGSEKERIGADTPIAPNSGYGLSKYLADQICEVSGSRCAIVRIGAIFGKRGPDHLGLNRALRAAAQGLPPTIVGKGKARRNYVHVDDAARAIVSCLNSQPTGVLYCAGSEVLTIAEMMTLIGLVYLEGTLPFNKDGPEALDQIVEVSQQLPRARPFRVALESERDQ